jgi:hypothetical protein
VIHIHLQKTDQLAPALIQASRQGNGKLLQCIGALLHHAGAAAARHVLQSITRQTRIEGRHSAQTLFVELASTLQG